MATLTTLSDTNGPLTNVSIPLGRFEFQSRWFYGSPDVMAWMRTDLPAWKQGRLCAFETPMAQFFGWMHKWISGREMSYGRMFHDMHPSIHEVWEAKTPDVRVFGWMYAPRVFIAVHAGYADDYKVHRGRRLASYEYARNHVVSFRDSLDLDHPKFATGTFDALVRI